MCGINGIKGDLGNEVVSSVVRRMNDAMRHRGPDDDGIFSMDGLGFGHRRLSIIDLTTAGHQPMFSKDRKCVIVFNGEIYNFQTLKNGLSDYSFDTHTDTEVILAAYQKWGIDFIGKLDGMFAIAIYDFNLKVLFLIRDRLGVKPLYYVRKTSGETIFASEIRSLLESGRVNRTLNESQLSNYLTFQTTIGEQTLITDILSLPPGTYATVSNSEFKIRRYWDIALMKNSTDSYETAKANVRTLFFKAVEKRLISDVPLGAFLSGGIDSSAVVAAMSVSTEKVNTFNINFNEKKFSEAEYATQVAGKYHTHHTQIDLSPEDFLAMFPAALNAMDYPSWDGVNTYVVSKAVKEAGLSVALSGIGGDEWFGGYPVFGILNNDKFKKLKLIPLFLRKMLVKILSGIKVDFTLDKKYELLTDKISIENTYYAIRKLFTKKQIRTLLNNPCEFDHRYFPLSANYSDISIAEWNNYLMPVLLRDTDQMSMAHALEIREPFLDYQLIEYVLTLPDEFKKGETIKSLLVNALGDLLPTEVVDRPKMGFVLPWQEWLKADLKLFVDEGLDELCRHSAFNADSIMQLKDDYYNNRKNVRWTMILNLSMLGLWMKRNGIR